MNQEEMIKEFGHITVAQLFHVAQAEIENDKQDSTIAIQLLHRDRIRSLMDMIYSNRQHLKSLPQTDHIALVVRINEDLDRLGISQADGTIAGRMQKVSKEVERLRSEESECKAEIRKVTKDATGFDDQALTGVTRLRTLYKNRCKEIDKLNNENSSMQLSLNTIRHEVAIIQPTQGSAVGAVRALIVKFNDLQMKNTVLEQQNEVLAGRLSAAAEVVRSEYIAPLEQKRKDEDAILMGQIARATGKGYLTLISAIDGIIALCNSYRDQWNGLSASLSKEILQSFENNIIRTVSEATCKDYVTAYDAVSDVCERYKAAREAERVDGEVTKKLAKVTGQQGTLNELVDSLLKDREDGSWGRKWLGQRVREVTGKELDTTLYGECMDAVKALINSHQQWKSIAEKRQGLYSEVAGKLAKIKEAVNG